MSKSSQVWGSMVRKNFPDEVEIYTGQKTEFSRMARESKEKIVLEEAGHGWH